MFNHYSLSLIERSVKYVYGSLREELLGDSRAQREGWRFPRPSRIYSLGWRSLCDNLPTPFPAAATWLIAWLLSNASVGFTSIEVLLPSNLKSLLDAKPSKRSKSQTTEGPELLRDSAPRQAGETTVTLSGSRRPRAAAGTPSGSRRRASLAQALPEARRH